MDKQTGAETNANRPTIGACNKKPHAAVEETEKI